MVDTTHRTLRAANIARQKEWDADNQLTLTYRLNELAGETGEACNIGKKIERERLGIVGSRATVRDLAEELADVVICADLVAMGEGIDLDQAVINKFNRTSAKVGMKTQLANGAHPSRGDAQVAHRFRFAADILEGMTEGVDGDRLGALVRWALHGKVGGDEREHLIRIFEAPHQAAEDEEGWVGDTRAEAIADIERVTAEAEDFPAQLPQWLDMATAPRDGAYVSIAAQPPKLPWRLALSQPIAILCEMPRFKEEPAELTVVEGCWSTQDDKGCWWNLQAEAPLDLIALGWMPLIQPQETGGEPAENLRADHQQSAERSR